MRVNPAHPAGRRHRRHSSISACPWCPRCSIFGLFLAGVACCIWCVPLVTGASSSQSRHKVGVGKPLLRPQGCALSINLWRLVSIAVWTRSARWNRIWLSHSLGVSQSNAFEATLWVRHLRLCPLGGDGTLCPLGGLRNPLWAPHSWRLVDFGMPILALRLLPRFHLLSAWTHLRGGV